MLTRFDTYSDEAIDAKKRRRPEGRERTILVELCFICKSEVICSFLLLQQKSISDKFNAY